MANRRKSTSTSNFGVSRRESHDASGFYARFTPPEYESSEDVAPQKSVDEIFVGNASSMTKIDDNSVALVVTSPPYFAGKEYEEALGEGDVPATYLEYLQMLADVFAECVRKLEPGGRIAVNVANLGRKPYRSLSADVIRILQDDLGLLLRGEIIWQKARGSTGSCAWGSFQRPTNPVLRDLTERVIVASRGRFDRAIAPRRRHEVGLPSASSLSKDEFMDATTDVWEIPAESATRVGHPAPFPVALPERLINLYTYRDDLVLDPFMGSGTTAVAAVRSGRHYVGYDTDAAYVERARARVEDERSRLEQPPELGEFPPTLSLPAVPESAPVGEDPQARAVREGKAAKEIAYELLKGCGFTEIDSGKRLHAGVEVNFRAVDKTGQPWYFDVSGAFTSTRPGLKRTDTLWKAIGKAAVIAEVEPSIGLVLLTTDVPPKGSAGDLALREVCGDTKAIKAVFLMLSTEDQTRLRTLAETGRVEPG
jgi:DNA modification methylase